MRAGVAEEFDALSAEMSQLWKQRKFDVIFDQYYANDFILNHGSSRFTSDKKGTRVAATRRHTLTQRRRE